MPIFSYLAYPIQGAKEKLLKDLNSLAHCEAIPSENKDILVLITDTPNDDQEKELQKMLKQLSSLQSLGMTFGHGDM
jgi:nitrate reductase NapAB chaperone NapD